MGPNLGSLGLPTLALDPSYLNQISVATPSQSHKSTAIPAARSQFYWYLIASSSRALNLQSFQYIIINTQGTISYHAFTQIVVCKDPILPQSQRPNSVMTPSFTMKLSSSIHIAMLSNGA